MQSGMDYHLKSVSVGSWASLAAPVWTTPSLVLMPITRSRLQDAAGKASRAAGGAAEGH